MRLFTDTVTFYNKIGEENGKAVYSKCIIKNVRLISSSDVRERTKKPASSAVMYFSLLRSRPDKPFLDFSEWRGSSQKEHFFTFSPSGDFFVPGTAEFDDPTDAPEFYRTEAVLPSCKCSKRLAHIKIVGH